LRKGTQITRGNTELYFLYAIAVDDNGLGIARGLPPDGRARDSKVTHIHTITSSGAVAITQRFDVALNPNIHLYMLFLN